MEAYARTAAKVSHPSRLIALRPAQSVLCAESAHPSRVDVVDKGLEMIGRRVPPKLCYVSALKMAPDGITPCRRSARAR